MLNVQKRVDGIPIFDKYDRPLYHLNSEQNSNKYVVVNEINNMDGHFIELKGCLNENYEKINHNSPLSATSYSVEDPNSMKSVLNWVNKWNNKRKNTKNIKFVKSKSKYRGSLNNDIPLNIKLFKYNNKYAEENVLKQKEKMNNKKGSKIEINKKQNKKKLGNTKPSFLCIPIKTFLKKKEPKIYNSNMSIDEVHFQQSVMNYVLPNQSNKTIRIQNINIDEDKNAVINFEKRDKSKEIINSMKQVNIVEIAKKNSKKGIIQSEITEIPDEDDKNLNINDKLSNASYNEVKRLNKNKQNLQLLVIPPRSSCKYNILSASTISNDEMFDYLKCQESTPLMTSPCYSSVSTLISPPSTNSSIKTNADESKFEINSSDCVDYLKDRNVENTVNKEVFDIERSFSLPASTENDKNKNIRRRSKSYDFSSKINKYNLYSENNQTVMSDLCKIVENKQNNNDKPSMPPKTEGQKPFVKGHARTESRHRRSHAVCLSGDQIFNFGDEENKQNNRNEYPTREGSTYSQNSNDYPTREGSTFSQYSFNFGNSNTTNYALSTKSLNRDIHLKRRTPNMIKYKNSNASLRSSSSVKFNSLSRIISDNSLSRDIELLRALKIKKSRSISKLEQSETTSTTTNNTTLAGSSTKSKESSSHEDLGISIRSNSSSSSNIVHYYFEDKNDNKNETNNQTSSVNDSSSGSSTYYYSEEDGLHNNDIGNLNNNMLSTKCNNESSDKFASLLPPTPMIHMI